MLTCVYLFVQMETNRETKIEIMTFMYMKKKEEIRLWALSNSRPRITILFQ